MLERLIHILNFHDVVVILRKYELFYRTSQTLILKIVYRIILSGAIFLIEHAWFIDFSIFIGLRLNVNDVIFVSESYHDVHLIVDLEAHLKVLGHC